MIITKINNNYSKTSYRANEQRKLFNAKQTTLEACSSAFLLPLIPLIDGDGIKETFKNRHKAKYFAGMASIAGLYIATKFVTNKFNPQKEIISSGILGAIILPAAMLADNWSQIEKKPMAKKWYAIAALAGGAVMGLASYINRTVKHLSPEPHKLPERLVRN